VNPNPDVDRLRAAADKAADAANVGGELLARHHRWFYRTWIVLLAGFVAVTVLYVITLSSQQDQVAGNAARIGQTRHDATVAKRRADVAATTATVSKSRADVAAKKARQIVQYLRGDRGLSGVPGQNGRLGTPGPAGPAGPGSTIPGPKGDPGAPSTIPGPATNGKDGTNGTNGQDSKVPGPAGQDSIVPGPRGPSGPACPPGSTPTPEQIATMAGVRDVVLCERTP